MITVFTPTYNRAYILPKLYESLCTQTFTDFEWLVVDDGSTDNTEELITSYIAEKKIDIRYIKQVNGGKHRAINRGAIEARGELFSIVDSDDYLANDALDSLYKAYLPVKNDKSIGAFCNPRKFKNKSIYIGDNINCFRREFMRILPMFLEYWDTFRTSVILEYPFPDIKGETFCSESIILLNIDQKYSSIIFGGEYYYVEYLPDGLTANSLKRRIQNVEYAKLTYMYLYKYSYKTIKASINYWRFYFHSNRKIKPSLLFILKTFALAPFGLCMYVIDKYRLL